MRRLALLIGLPVLLLVMWSAGEGGSPKGAVQVGIETSDVSGSRSAVISRLAGIGGVRTAEDTEFDDSVATSSELTFDIAVMRIEEAIAELADVGGSLTSTKLDITSAGSDARSVDQSLTAVQNCLAGVATDLSANTAGAAEALDACESEVRSLGDRVAGVGSPLETTELTVVITPRSNGSAALFWAVGALALVLAVMAYLTLRSARANDLIDISDPDLSRFDRELQSRRN